MDGTAEPAREVRVADSAGASGVLFVDELLKVVVVEVGLVAEVLEDVLNRDEPVVVGV